MVMTLQKKFDKIKYKSLGEGNEKGFNFFINHFYYFIPFL